MSKLDTQKFDNPNVTRHQVAVQNTTLPDVAKLELEYAENAKALAANPGRADAATLNARQLRIRAILHPQTGDFTDTL